MIERRDEQALLVLGQLPRGDVEGKTLDAYKLPHGVEFGLCRFLEPDFPAVGKREAECDGIGRTFGIDTADQCPEPIAIARMDPRQKAFSGCGFAAGRIPGFARRWRYAATNPSRRPIRTS